MAQPNERKDPMSKHSQHASHNDRPDIAGEHAIGDAGQLVLGIVFVVVWIADTFWLRLTTSWNQAVPLALRIPLGLAFLALAGYLSFRGMAIVFGEIREEPIVIRQEMFGIVRHPIYLGEILLYAALMAWSLSLAAGVVWLIAIGFLHWISRHEEALLLARFGDEYRAYMRDVPMWIPRLRRR